MLFLAIGLVFIGQTALADSVEQAPAAAIVPTDIRQDNEAGSAASPKTEEPNTRQQATPNPKSETANEPVPSPSAASPEDARQDVDMSAL